MVLDYLQTMWAQKPVCGLFANNVGSLAAIVGPTSRVFAANVSRQVSLFAGQPADDCGPLHVLTNVPDHRVCRLNGLDTGIPGQLVPAIHPREASEVFDVSTLFRTQNLIGS